MEYVARFAVISLERTQWVHKGCNGMTVTLQVLSTQVIL